MAHIFLINYAIDNLLNNSSSFMPKKTKRKAVKQLKNRLKIAQFCTKINRIIEVGAVLNKKSMPQAHKNHDMNQIDAREIVW